MAECTAHVRVWSKSGHTVSRCKCPLMSQSGPPADTMGLVRIKAPQPDQRTQNSKRCRGVGPGWTNVTGQGFISTRTGPSVVSKMCAYDPNTDGMSANVS